MEKRELELMLMRAWPAIEEYSFDGWILRYSGGYSKRSNCINPLYESYFDLEEKYEYCRKRYIEKGLPIIYKLIDSEVGMKIDEFLDKKDLKKRDMVSVKEIDLLNIDYDLKKLAVSWRFTQEWFDFFTEENKLNIEEKNILEKLLKKNDKSNFYVYKMENGKIVAGAMGAVVDDKLGIFNVYVKETHRKKGYATEVLEGMLVEARKINIKKAYLQVMEKNEKALNLYRKMGFVLKYRSWYRY